jgi:hypothetical protein
MGGGVAIGQLPVMRGARRREAISAYPDPVFRA